jgi:hypothetical protein
LHYPFIQLVELDVEAKLQRVSMHGFTLLETNRLENIRLEDSIRGVLVFLEKHQIKLT